MMSSSDGVVWIPDDRDDELRGDEGAEGREKGETLPSGCVWRSLCELPTTRLSRSILGGRYYWMDVRVS